MSTTSEEVGPEMTDSLPEWLQGFDEPVIKPSTKSSSKRFHRPDPAADEPMPGCRMAQFSDHRGKRDPNWTVVERSKLGSFYGPCGFCQIPEVDTADD